MPPCRCLCRHISALCWLGFWSWYGCLDAQKSSKQAFLCHPVWNLMQFFFKRYDVDSLPKLATRRFCFGNFGKFPKVFAAHALFPFRQCVGWGPGIASQQALPIGQWTYCESPKRMRSPARLTWVKGIEISAEYNDSARQLEQWYVASPKELEPVKTCKNHAFEDTKIISYN